MLTATIALVTKHSCSKAKEKAETPSGCFVGLVKAERWKIHWEEGLFSPLQTLPQILWHYSRGRGNRNAVDGKNFILIKSVTQYKRSLTSPGIRHWAKGESFISPGKENHRICRLQ